MLALRTALLLIVSASALVLTSTAPAATISGGNDLSCSISAAGAAECWGTNTLAALGSGTSVQRSYDPLPVTGLGSGVSDITAGTYAGCAIQSGAAKCWGNNQNGQVGDGSTTTVGVPPTQVSGLTGGVTRISSGNVHNCAIQNGAAFCWGGGNDGRTGAGDGVSTGAFGTPTPAPVTGAGSGATDIAGGVRHTCVIVSGVTSCTGGLGYGPSNSFCPSNYSSPYAWRPHPVCGPPAFSGSAATRVVSGGDVSCALLTDTSVWCWGSNTHGILGRGTAIASSQDPAPVVGLGSGVADISLTGSHGCALLQAGTVRCWGYNQNGQLGNGTARNSSNVPVDVSNLTGVTAIGAGTNHTCAIASGQRFCWGWNNNGMGQLGNEEVGDESYVPVAVIGSKRTPAPPASTPPPPGVTPPVTVPPTTQPATPSPRARFTVPTKVVKVDSKRRALVLTLRCPSGGPACTVRLPSNVKVKIQGRSYRLKVSGPRRIPAGRSAGVRVTLSTKAARRLKGRKATVKVRVVARAPGGTTTRTIKVTIKR